jgi:hypothetical protein
MFEVKPYPEFSWSMSRHKTFFTCRRKYAYQYYVSHNGWRFDAPPSAQEAYFLKKLSNLPMYVGDVLHQVIHTLITNYRGKPLPPLANIEKHVRDKLNQAYRYSQNQQLWHQKPKDVPLLRELVYGETPEASAISDITARLQACLEHLYQSTSFQDIMQGKHIHLYESEQFHSFRLNDIKVFVVMDVLYENEARDIWTITDWKTGKETEEDRNQLALYAMYLHDTYHIPHNKIEIRNEYLATGCSRTHAVEVEDLDQVHDMMLLSVGQMLQYVEDVERNKPIDLSLFEKQEHPQKCASCNFLKICQLSP